jgi:hypothetical protein
LKAFLAFIYLSSAFAYTAKVIPYYNPIIIG